MFNRLSPPFAVLPFQEMFFYFISLSIAQYKLYIIFKIIKVEPQRLAAFHNSSLLLGIKKGTLSSSFLKCSKEDLALQSSPSCLTLPGRLLRYICVHADVRSRFSRRSSGSSPLFLIAKKKTILTDDLFFAAKRT